MGSSLVPFIQIDETYVNERHRLVTADLLIESKLKLHQSFAK